jgi:type I restriction enzyme S subunit
MNAERLLEHYEKIADAPDAIARLRRFVLDLAVRGKLVPQDPNDEPASELLKRIAAEKARLVKAGEFHEPRSFVRIDRSDLPFVPASHWGWARLIDIARPSYGFAFPSGRFNSAKRGMPLIRIRDISNIDTEAYFDGDYDPGYVVKAGDYLVGMDGDFNLRRWKGKDGLLNQRVMRVNGWRCGIDPEFVKLPLQFVLDHLHGETSLTTVKHLSAKQVNGIEIPLPPLAEQRRIVVKVDELMALCDRLEASRQTREATRDKLAAASLARLNAPNPDTFRDDARFALDALPALTARADQIRHLRQTILNLAVRGKLVPQDLSDEPASALLKRITTKKADLIEAGIAKREKPTERETFPFDLPITWSWCALGQLCQLITKGSSPKWQGISYVAREGGLIFITSENVGNFTLRKLDELKYVEARFKDVEPRSMLRKGDILINLVGASIGRTALYNLEDEANINQAVSLVRLVDTSIGPSIDYLLMYLNSDAAVNLMLGSRVVTAQPNISLADVNGFPIPLPPLAEQRRIVAKVDELMARCDRLEASLATADDTRRRLLEALLAEALAPVEERELEAAE